ncbi:MAG: DUF2845 domain-containing protein [Woeseiaceae bacterium]
MILRITVVTLMLAYCGTADAYGSLRCKGKIIDVGMSMNKVLALCGKPDSRKIEQAPVRHRNVIGFSSYSGISHTELLEYNRGWGKFPVVLRFEDETLRRVEYGERRSGAGRDD